MPKSTTMMFIESLDYKLFEDINAWIKNKRETDTFTEYKTDDVKENDSHKILTPSSFGYYSEERYDPFKYYNTQANNDIYLKSNYYCK